MAFEKVWCLNRYEVIWKWVPNRNDSTSKEEFSYISFGNGYNKFERMTSQLIICINIEKSVIFKQVKLRTMLKHMTRSAINPSTAKGGGG